MFLHILDDEEKKAFLDLSTYAMNIDQEVTASEEELIKFQCREMGIEHAKVSLENFDLKNTLEIFESLESRRVIFIEILSMFFIDKEFQDEEKNLLNDISEHYGFDDDFMKEAILHAQVFVNVFYSGRELIYQ